MSDRAADEPSTDDSDGEAAAAATEEAENGGDADEEWQFSLEDIEAREAEKQATEAVTEASRQPIQPGEPKLESVAFVLLGVVVAAYILSRLFV